MRERGGGRDMMRSVRQTDHAHTHAHAHTDTTPPAPSPPERGLDGERAREHKGTGAQGRGIRAPTPLSLPEGEVDKPACPALGDKCVGFPDITGAEKVRAATWYVW